MTSSALRFSGERTDDAPLEQQLGSPCRVAAPAEAHREHVPRGRLSTCPSPAGAAMPTRARAHGGGTSRARRGAGARGGRQRGEDRGRHQRADLSSIWASKAEKQTYPASGPHQLLTGGPRARENSSRSRRLRGQRCASPRPPGTRRRAAAAGGCSLRWPLARASVGKPKRYRQR